MWCNLQYKQVAPVGDRVFVKIDKEEEKTSSGILLPSSAQKKPTQGEIVTAGDAKALKASMRHSHRFPEPRGMLECHESDTCSAHSFKVQGVPGKPYIWIWRG